MNFEMFKLDFKKAEEPANIRWIIEKAREFQKNIYLGFIDFSKSFDCVDHNRLWKILKEMGIPYHEVIKEISNEQWMPRNLGTLQTFICYNLHIVRWLIGNMFQSRINW